MTSAGAVRLRVMTTLPRSGTHWVKQMISQVLGLDPLERPLLDARDLREALETETSGRLMYEHFDHDTHAALLNPTRHPGLRMIQLYRNPVDAMISGFHYFAVKGWLPDERLGAVENFKLYLHGYWLGRRLPERCRLAFPVLKVSLREWIRQRVIGWFRSGYCLAVRYEDLLDDPRLQLERALVHLCVPHTREAIEEAVESFTFRKLSGGRDRGDVDATSHYRRGLPGEWRDVLNEHDLEAVHDQLGDYLELLGYDLDAPGGIGARGELQWSRA